MQFSENIVNVEIPPSKNLDNIHPGKIYKRKDPADDSIGYYLLATVDYNQYSLINLKCGNRFLDAPKENPIEVFSKYISQFTELPVGTKITIEVKN